MNNVVYIECPKCHNYIEISIYDTWGPRPHSPFSFSTCHENKDCFICENCNYHMLTKVILSWYARKPYAT